MNLIRPSSRMLLAFAVASATLGCGDDDPVTPRTGSLAVEIAGLPTGSPAAVEVTGPDGFAQSVEATTTLTALPAGTYTIAAASVATTESRWTPTPLTQTVTVAGSDAPTTAAVTYALSTSRLALVVSGLPSGTTANVTVTGPAGFTRTATGSQAFDLLEPGTYTVTAADVATGATIHRPTPASTSVTLTPSTTATTVAVTYGVAPGDLAITISGLPSGASAAATVTGPGGFTRALTGTTTLTALAPGSYTIAATPVTTTEGRWTPTPGTQMVNVASDVPAAATIAYALATARLSLAVTGLPTGANAVVTLAGPGGFTRVVTGSESFDLLEPGTYTITAGDVTSGATIYRPAPASTSVTLTPSTIVTNVGVAYAPVPGSLTITVAGLPGGAAAAATLTGPGGFMREITGTTTVSGLAPGSYTLAASPTSSAAGTVIHTVTPGTQTVAVTSSTTASATLTYSVLQLGLEQVATSLSSPIFLTAPAGDQRLFIVERPGRIRILRSGQLLATPFLDISSIVSTDGERGLLSVAFDPSHATNGFFYVYYTALNGDITVARYSATPGSDVASPSGTIVITVPHSTHSNHNGGLVMFGPDGMLYLATGDGGSGGDPDRNGQNPATLLGKMLRIDVRTLPYTVPATNPFVGQAGRAPEIWAMGLRNPWRFDFDAPPGAPANVIIADVGQNVWEEINVMPAAQAGVNYGWNTMEGAHCFQPSTGCNEAGLTRPVLEYDHSQGCSITGGFVYRGTAIPELAGHYFYSDFCAGWIASMNGDRTTGFVARRWDTPHVGNVVSFGEDAAGEVYVLTSGGAIHRIVRR